MVRFAHTTMVVRPARLEAAGEAQVEAAAMEPQTDRGSLQDMNGAVRKVVPLILMI